MNPLCSRDLLSLIAERVDATTLGRCCCVCVLWRSVFGGFSHRWSRLLQQEFGTTVGRPEDARGCFARAMAGVQTWRRVRRGSIRTVGVTCEEGEVMAVQTCFTTVGERLLVQELQRDEDMSRAGLMNVGTGAVESLFDCSYVGVRRAAVRGAFGSVVVATQEDKVLLERNWDDTDQHEPQALALAAMPRNVNLEAVAALSPSCVLVSLGRRMLELNPERSGSSWCSLADEIEEQCDAVDMATIRTRQVFMYDVARELCPLHESPQCALAIWSSGQVGWYDQRAGELHNWHMQASLHEAVSGALSPSDRYAAVCLRRVVRVYDVRMEGRVFATRSQGARRCRFFGSDVAVFLGDRAVSGFDLAASQFSDQASFLAPHFESPAFHGCGPSLEIVGGSILFADFAPGRILVFEPEVN